MSCRTPMLDEVQEQPNAVRVLQRLVEGQIQYPLLLVGEEGTGRRFSAMAAVHDAIVRKKGKDSPDVQQVQAGVHPDVHVVSAPAGKELGIDAAREICQLAGMYPTRAPYRFFIVDGIDRATSAASNALLKTLEELPAKSRFIMTAEFADRVLPTIRSRCGLVPFRRLSETFIRARLESVEPDLELARVYARVAEGSMGRALRLWGSGRLALRDQMLALLRDVVARDYTAVFATIDDQKDDLDLAVRFLRQLVHDVLLLPVDASRILNLDAFESLRELCLSGTSLEQWATVALNLRQVYELDMTLSVNMPFHVKSALMLP